MAIYFAMWLAQHRFSCTFWHFDGSALSHPAQGAANCFPAAVPSAWPYRCAQGWWGGDPGGPRRVGPGLPMRAIMTCEACRDSMYSRIHPSVRPAIHSSIVYANAFVSRLLTCYLVQTRTYNPQVQLYLLQLLVTLVRLDIYYHWELPNSYVQQSCLAAGLAPNHPPIISADAPD